MEDKSFIHAVIESARKDVIPVNILFEEYIENKEPDIKSIEIAELFLGDMNSLLTSLYHRYERLLYEKGIDYYDIILGKKREYDIKVAAKIFIIELIQKIFNALSFPSVLLQDYKKDNKKWNVILARQAMETIKTIRELLAQIDQKIDES